MLGFSSYSDFVVAEDKAATTEKVKQEPSHQSQDTTTSVDQTTEQFSVDSNDEKVAIDVSDGGQNIGQQVNIEPEAVDGGKLEKQSGLSEQMPSDSDNTKNADASGELQSTDTQTNREKDKAAKKSDLPEQTPSDEKLILDYLEQLKRSNQKMSRIDNEQVMDKMLGKENVILEKLVALLGKTTLDELAIPKKIERQNFLKLRIAANEERGNDLAIQRDKIKLAYYKVSHDTLDYLQFLMTASRSYVAINKIVNESITRRDIARKDIKRYKIPEFDFSSKVHSQLKKNSGQLNLAHDTYRDILTFVITNPDKISTTHWFQKVSLLSSIAFFNNFDIIRSINHKLTPFQVDVGGIIVSLIIIMLVVFCYPLVVKGISWVVEKYFLNNGNDYTEEIYRELKHPVFALIVFFSLDLATYALLYKTEYKSSLEDLVFVVYVTIYLWIIFKVMDSVVIAQLDKFSKKNKQLRRELINLGIQVSKGLFIIIAVSVLLNRFGISIAALMSTLGIGGLAFALAAKDSLSNLLGGVTLLIDNVFSLGDWVKIGEVEGTAVQIGLRSTTIRTFDNALITIPNSVISVSSVRNWNRRAIGRRIKMRVGVTYQSNMDDIRQAIEDIRDMLRDHTEIANPKEQLGDKRKQFRFMSREDTQGIKSTQLVFMDRFNDFSIDILIYCFSRSVDWSKWLEVKEDVLFKIAEILKQNNLEFAYPTAVRIYRSKGIDDTEELGMINSKIDSVA
jgi:MscS family membrane protein